MEEMLNHVSTPQLIVMFLIQLWVVVIFPYIVLRKLNYLTELVESQFEQDPPETQDPQEPGTGS